MQTILQAREAISRAHNIVFFTGAGMSAESGIATFRDALTGLWARFDPAQLASADGFRADPPLVWGWYEARRAGVIAAQPNAGHTAIAKFARLHLNQKTVRIVTQNVDDLHERAGSENVIHLHGSLFAARCFDCATPFALGAPDAALETEGKRIAPPRCNRCAGMIRPGVVWFGEALPEAQFESAVTLARAADVFVVVGTSGVVEPAASVARTAARAGATVILIDPHASEHSAVATHVIAETAASALPNLLAHD